MVRALLPWVLLCPILFFAFWLRVQGVEQLPAGQFTETDAYLYYWQAQIISDQGQLPERDMHRWLPLGRDLSQTLNLYSYVLAYTHKAIATVFPNVLLYHIALYVPVICFCIGLGVLCFFLYHTYGWLFSTVSGVLLTTLPGTIERSTAGFGDRDAWCLMIGILSVISYLVSLQVSQPRGRLFWTLASGLTVFLGGISWEGFGVFLSVILVTELWRFLTSETEEGLGYNFLWVLTFVPTLYLASPAYRSGYGFAEHLSAFVLLPPVVLLILRGGRRILLEKIFISNKLRPPARTLALGLTLASVTLVLGYVLIQRNTFGNTTVPLSQNAVMQAMTELKAPHYGYWVFRYGTIFIVGSLGFILIPLHLWKKHGAVLSIPLAFFTLSTFFRQPLDRLWGVAFGNALFGIAIVGCVFGLIALGWKRKTKALNEIVSIAFILWFVVWVGLSRDAKRYDFFIGVALAFGTAVLIQLLVQLFSEKLQYSSKAALIKIGTAIIFLTTLMCLPIKHAHTYRSLFAATQMRQSTPTQDIAAALYWMKAILPDTAIVAANWSYGSQLNVLAGVKTITDQDTYLQHWITLYYRYVIHAKNEREALEFLKTHKATHLMLVGDKPAIHFLQGQVSRAFVPVYPSEKFTEANVNVWKLYYPRTIETNLKYLETGFPEIDADLRLH